MFGLSTWKHATGDWQTFPWSLSEWLEGGEQRRSRKIKSEQKGANGGQIF